MTLAPDPQPSLRPIWRALAFIPLYVLFWIALSLAAGLILGPGTLRRDFELALGLAGVVTCLASLLTAALLLAQLDRTNFCTLGFWFYPGWGRELVLGLAGGFLLISLVVAFQWLLGGFEIRGLAADGGLLAGAAAWYLLVLFPAAAGEELMFRGYPFQRLVDACGQWPAIGICGVLFGAVHLPNPSPTALSTLNTALMSVLLALAYLKTRGLWLPIGLHFAWNYGLGFVYSLPVSGIELRGVLWQVEVRGARWLTGGAYGPEGNLLTTLVALAAIVAITRAGRFQVSSTPPRAVQ